MNQSVVVKQMLVAVVAWALAHAADLGEPGGGAADARLGAGYKTDKAACALLTDPAKDICIDVARAKIDAARAGIEFSNALTRGAADVQPLAGRSDPITTEAQFGSVPAPRKPARSALAQECDAVGGDAAPPRCVVVRAGGGKS